MLKLICESEDGAIRAAAKDVLKFGRNDFEGELCIRIRVVPDLGEDIRVAAGGTSAVVEGKDAPSAVFGLYDLLRKCGYLFTFSGIVHPKNKICAFPELAYSHTPDMKERGIRMHLNFVQDQSCFTEKEFADFIRGMPRQKMNFLLFHMYNCQEFYPFSYRGVKHLDLAIGNLEKKPLSDTMIGRDKIKVKKYWYPRELEGIEDNEQLMLAVYARYRRMMELAKELGLQVAVSFEPETLGETLGSHLQEWSEDTVAINKKYSLTNDWQESWCGKKLVDADIRNPVMYDIAAERCQAILDAYPMIDQLHLISKEGVSYKRDTEEEYIAELERIFEKFGLDRSLLDLDSLREIVPEESSERALNPQSTQYWTVMPGENHFATVCGVLRFVEYAYGILCSAPLAERMSREGVKPVITVYTPNPATIRRVTPIVAAMLPEGFSFHLLADYGAADIADNMGLWKPLFDKKLDVGVISWLEFDGCMMLQQGWMDAIRKNVAVAHGMGARTIYFNHWRVRGNEHNAEAAAEAAWDLAGSSNADYFSALYGAQAAEKAQLAYELLEKATVYSKQNNFNVGFTTDWVINICTDPPGYYWKYLLVSADNYAAAARAFRDLQAVCEGAGRTSAHYLSDMCRISEEHLRAVLHLQDAKLPLVGYGCWPLDKKRKSLPPPYLLKRLKESAEKGLAKEYTYMKVLAKWVKTSDQQGQLAMHQQGLIEPFERLAAKIGEWYERESGCLTTDSFC